MSPFIRDWSVITGAGVLVLGAALAAETYLPDRPANVPAAEPATFEVADTASSVSQDTADFSAPHPGKYGTTNGMWAFGKITDRMRGETITEAFAISRSNGGDELLIRLQRKNGATYRATLELRRGYGFAICGNDCEIAISTDGRMSSLVARNANTAATELEVFDARGFEALLKNSEVLFVELELDDGPKQYEFRTDGLDWSAAEGAEPMFTS